MKMSNETRLRRIADRMRPENHTVDIDRRVSQLIEELERNHPGEAARIIAEMSPDVPR